MNFLVLGGTSPAGRSLMSSVLSDPSWKGHWTQLTTLKASHPDPRVNFCALDPNDPLVAEALIREHTPTLILHFADAIAPSTPAHDSEPLAPEDGAQLDPKIAFYFEHILPAEALLNQCKQLSLRDRGRAVPYLAFLPCTDRGDKTVEVLRELIESSGLPSATFELGHLYSSTSLLPGPLSSTVQHQFCEAPSRFNIEYLSLRLLDRLRAVSGDRLNILGRSKSDDAFERILPLTSARYLHESFQSTVLSLLAAGKPAGHSGSKRAELGPQSKLNTPVSMRFSLVHPSSPRLQDLCKDLEVLSSGKVSQTKALRALWELTVKPRNDQFRFLLKDPSLLSASPLLLSPFLHSELERRHKCQTAPPSASSY